MNIVPTGLLFTQFPAKQKAHFTDYWWKIRREVEKISKRLLGGFRSLQIEDDLH